MGNIELRWLTWEEEETVMPPLSEVQFGGPPFPKRMVKKRKLQFRKFVNTTVYAGMPSQDFVNQTAVMQWSEWADVPEVTEKHE